MRSALEAEKFHVFEAGAKQAGLSEAGTRKPDIIILDLKLPDGDGVDFIRDYRAWSAIPIIVLSSRTDESDKILALDAGADDYLTKPFGAGELLARVRALLRRRVTPNSSDEFKFGDVSVKFSDRRLTKAGTEIHLTPIEFRLLTTLITNAGKVLTYRQLLREVWGPAHVEQSHYLRIYMGHLRQKLEIDPTRPAHFMTETAIGYRFVP